MTPVCAFTIQQTELVTIEDAVRSALFHPSVGHGGTAKVRFYRGAPILTPTDTQWARSPSWTWCLARTTDEQGEALRRVARQAGAQLELPRRLRVDRSILDEHVLSEMIASMADAVFVTDCSGRVRHVNHETEVLLNQTSLRTCRPVAARLCPSS